MALPEHRSPLVGPDEAAIYLATTKRHIYGLVHERKLAHTHIGGKLRFRLRDLDAFIDAGWVEAVG